MAYYSFADKMAIEHEDVRRRIFAQRLESKVKKRFRDLPPNSIRNIEVVDEILLNNGVIKKTTYIT